MTKKEDPIIEEMMGDGEMRREIMRHLGRRRWADKTEAEKSAHGKMMARRKAEKERK